ncbi:hypothetical protein [Enhygromyxa salina]|uniref:Glycosyl transferase family 2 n=1 Tax=Enhygromyxa salina TaxID=215803 RepID=A0A2S9YBV8_9BACT|nr:hypothetical protein [Enhygromyxa salina]PRQ02594.1 hypothetical protein ENSA7_55660 [Enhygromyxa salina]
MSITKYLDRHASVTADQCAGLEAFGPWDHAVVIPARREGAQCLAAAQAPAQRHAVVCVLVVNAGHAADAPDDLQDQLEGTQLLEAVEAHPELWRREGVSLHRVGSLDVVLVDCVRGDRRFDSSDGVGLARKIGADLVLRLHQLGRLRSPWIHCTDADARLPAEHFERVASSGANVIATVAPFWHEPGDDPEADLATARYELSLRYYVAGLRFAGSPFAFHTIGSLISVACSAYASVRGFPRRQAGEDFYLLNKLAKLGIVRELGGAPVEIRSRRSARVPFGTGPAVAALISGQALQVYDPRVFQALARVLRSLDQIVSGAGLGALAELTRELDAPQLHGMFEAAQTLVERYPPAQLAQRLHERFDGFRTLKLIHELTASRWPKLAWPDAVARAPFIEFSPDLPIDAQRRAL